MTGELKIESGNWITRMLKGITGFFKKEKKPVPQPNREKKEVKIPDDVIELNPETVLGHLESNFLTTEIIQEWGEKPVKVYIKILTLPDYLKVLSKLPADSDYIVPMMSEICCDKEGKPHFTIEQMRKVYDLSSATTQLKLMRYMNSMLPDLEAIEKN